MGQTVFEPWNDPDAKPLIQFRNVTKRFGDFTAIDNQTLDIFYKNTDFTKMRKVIVKGR